MFSSPTLDPDYDRIEAAGFCYSRMYNRFILEKQVLERDKTVRKVYDRTEILKTPVPCTGTVAWYDPVAVAELFAPPPWIHKSVTVAFDCAVQLPPNLENSSVILWLLVPVLTSATTQLVPSGSTFLPQSPHAKASSHVAQ